MRHAALRFTMLGLLAICLACSSDPTNLTSPTLDGASFSSQMGNGNGNGGGPPGGGETYTFLLSGDITSSGGLNGGLITANGGTTNFHDEVNSGITLNVSFLAMTGLPDFDTCFDGATDAEPGVVILDVDSSGAAEALFTFEALNDDGGTAIFYELVADNGTASGTFLPQEIGDAVDLTMMGWRVKNRVKKDGKKDPCIGFGSFNLVVTVTRTE